MSKSIFASRTFWLNVAGLVIALGSGAAGVHLDPKLAASVLAAGNIALRLITEDPVHLFPPK